MIDVEPAIRAEFEALMPLPEGSRRDWADVLERAGRRQRRSRRRLVLAVAIGVCVLAIASASIAAGLGAFSGVTIDEAKACVPSTTALTTPSGARVLTGETAAGVSCLAYENANGAGGRTAGRLGPSPRGDIIAMRTQHVIVGLVPPGYTTLKVGSIEIPITNRVFLVNPKLMAAPALLIGTAGTSPIDLRQLAAP